MAALRDRNAILCLDVVGNLKKSCNANAMYALKNGDIITKRNHINQLFFIFFFFRQSYFYSQSAFISLVYLFVEYLINSLCLYDGYACYNHAK